VIVRRLRRDDAVPAGYRALVLGLWEARRAGARSLELSGDDPDVVAQIQGAEPPPPAAIGPYLQVRALLNAFRKSRIRCAASEHSRDAAAAAAVAVRSRRRSDAELPLWAAASKAASKMEAA
jgi:hypothetical protein